MKVGTSYNIKTGENDNVFNVTMSDYMVYTLEITIMLRLINLQASRDGLGVPKSDINHPLNEQIKALKDIAEQFEIKLMV